MVDYKDNGGGGLSLGTGVGWGRGEQLGGNGDNCN